MKPKARSPPMIEKKSTTAESSGAAAHDQRAHDVVDERHDEQAPEQHHDGRHMGSPRLARKKR
jgi:hypothetical protein